MVVAIVVFSVSACLRLVFGRRYVLPLLAGARVSRRLYSKKAGKIAQTR
jgi:hypothetical protein